MGFKSIHILIGMLMSKYYNLQFNIIQKYANGGNNVIQTRQMVLEL